MTGARPISSEDGLRALRAYIAHEVYGRPTEKLWLAGVTGTNGKTSCGQWIAQAFNALGRKTAVIGTLGSGFPASGTDARAGLSPRSIPRRTRFSCTGAWPEFLREGALGVAMEVSSASASTRGRVNGAQFDVALLTNLSRDHLDYHGDMEHYAAAKMQLFDAPGLSVRSSIWTMCSACASRKARRRQAGVRRLQRPCRRRQRSRAGLCSRPRSSAGGLSEAGIAFGLLSSWGRAEVKSGLLGRFNVANLLGVLGVLLRSGGWHFRLRWRQSRRSGRRPGACSAWAAQASRSPWSTMPTPRMRWKGGTHRAAALAASGRLICIFGCGGDRDRGKRSLMGAIAARSADRVLLTSDNPRGEDPVAIITDILEGVLAEVQNGQAPLVIADRREAINAAISAAAGETWCLIAGKGHEDYQEIAGQRIPFSDAAVVAEALSAWKP